MGALTGLALFASALFAWSMGSHYTGSVAGTAYGARVFSLRTALVLTAVFTLIGSVSAGLNVIGTYAGVLTGATRVDIAGAQLAAAIVTSASTYFKLPTSTIQIYAFSLLGMALVERIPVNGIAFGLLIAGWVAGPLVAFGVGFLLARLASPLLRRRAQVGHWFLVVVALYSAFVLGSNDVSNAASSLVSSHLLTPRLAALFGGGFMALGVLTWGRRTLERIGQDIIPLDVSLAAVAQFSKALTLTALNLLGYNASINQTIVGGLVGAGTAVARNKVNRRVVRNIMLNWTLSPVMGLACSALVSLGLHAIISAT